MAAYEGYTTGDTRPDLSGVLTSAGAPVANLTGATLVVHVKQPDHAVLILAAVAGEDGAWTAPLPAGGFTRSGSHFVEVQVTYADGSIETFPADEALPVREQYA